MSNPIFFSSYHDVLVYSSLCSLSWCSIIQLSRGCLWFLQNQTKVSYATPRYIVFYFKIKLGSCVLLFQCFNCFDITECLCVIAFTFTYLFSISMNVLYSLLAFLVRLLSVWPSSVKRIWIALCFWIQWYIRNRLIKAPLCDWLMSMKLWDSVMVVLIFVRLSAQSQIDIIVVNLFLVDVLRSHDVWIGSFLLFIL